MQGRTSSPVPSSEDCSSPVTPTPSSKLVRRQRQLVLLLPLLPDMSSAPQPHRQQQHAALQGFFIPYGRCLPSFIFTVSPAIVLVHFQSSLCISHIGTAQENKPESHKLEALPFPPSSLHHTVLLKHFLILPVAAGRMSLCHPVRLCH